MGLLVDLASGKSGLVVAPPDHLTIEAEDATSVAFNATAPGQGWWLFFFPGVHLDLDAAHHAVLERDIKRHTRVLFETMFAQLAASDEEPSARPPRTNDATWSPLIEVERFDVAGGAACCRVGSPETNMERPASPNAHVAQRFACVGEPAFLRPLAPIRRGAHTRDWGGADMGYDYRRGSAHHPGNHDGTAQPGAAIGKRTLTMDLQPAQLKGALGGPEAAGHAQDGLADASGGGQPLPEPVRAKMEASFGADFSAVRVHEDGRASSIGALGYTQGNNIHFAPGQYQPDTQSGQELLGHELAHVVQQSEGRVAATTQAKGVDINDDSSLEREADEMGARAARGEPASATSRSHAGDAGGAAIQRKVIQLKDVPTHFGIFKTTTFAKHGTTGVNCVLEFHPDGDKIDATRIGLSQTIKRTFPDGSHVGIDPSKEGRRVKSGAGSDYILDRVSTKNNPIYGADDLAAGDGLDKTKADNNTSGAPTKVATPASGGNATYQLGHAYTDAGAKKTKEAALFDRPVGGGGTLFETVAMGLEGTDKDKYFGSVKWGYEPASGGGDVDIKDIELASMGVPTQNYLAAAELWNNTKTRGTLEVTANPAKARKASDMTEVDVAKGTKAKQLAEVYIAGKVMTKVETLDSAGAGTGKQYYINMVDLKDTQDGGDTVDVSIPIVFANPTAIPLYQDAEMKVKVKDLPANTRMRNTGTCTIHGSYGMTIVDGVDTGKTGYVDQKLIKRE